MSLVSSLRVSRQPTPFSAKTALRSGGRTARQTPPPNVEPAPNFTLYGAPAPRASHRSNKPGKPPGRPTSTPVGSPHSGGPVSPGVIPSPGVAIGPEVAVRPGGVVSPRAAKSPGAAKSSGVAVSPKSIPRLDFSALSFSGDEDDDAEGEESPVPAPEIETTAHEIATEVDGPCLDSEALVVTFGEGTVDLSARSESSGELSAHESARSAPGGRPESLPSRATSAETTVDETTVDETTFDETTIDGTSLSSSIGEEHVNEPESSTSLGEVTMNESERSISLGKSTLDESKRSTYFGKTIVNESARSLPFGGVTLAESRLSAFAELSSLSLTPWSAQSSCASSCATASSWSPRSCSSLPLDADADAATPFARRRLELVESGYYSPDASEVRMTVAEALEAVECARRLAQLLDVALGRELGLDRGWDDVAARRHSTPSVRRNADTTPAPPTPPAPPLLKGHDDTCRCSGPRLLDFSPQDLQRQRARLKKPEICVGVVQGGVQGGDGDLREVLKRVLMRRRGDVCPGEDSCPSARSQWSVGDL